MINGPVEFIPRTEFGKIERRFVCVQAHPPVLIAIAGRLFL